MEGAFQSDYEKRGRRWAGAVSVPALPEGALILETGCGNGKTLAALGPRAVGLDISPEAVWLACPAAAVCADIRRMPFADDAFDVVFCRHVLGHLREADRETAAAELFRVAKPGGVIYFVGFSRGDFRCGKGAEVEPFSFLRGDGIMTHYFSAEEVEGLFAGAEAKEERWTMRVRGEEYQRAEIRAEVHKNIRKPDEKKKVIPVCPKA
ncbi:MAG: class I SAM-dependent methyltransferase [Methanocorpusculum sp.]|nr:class I SAM-dependent methyltransferase [Methanocorpusculum sp.]